MPRPYKVAVLGGGAGGFFSALNMATHPSIQVTLIDRSGQLLSKVRISGGGRCNVTHNIFSPEEFSRFYPRGGRELRYAFERFGSGDTVTWFKDQGVLLKAEKDGRMFPITDSSETIIDCFTGLAAKCGVKILTGMDVKGIHKTESGQFIIKIDGIDLGEFDCLVIATGSSRQVWKWLEAMGHRIVDPVPSLFTFKIQDPRLDGMSGISFAESECILPECKGSSKGPLLITHWGLSGPAILRLSAWSARELFEKKYNTLLKVNFLCKTLEEVKKVFIDFKSSHPKKNLSNIPEHLTIPKRYWENLLQYLSIDNQGKWADLSAKSIQSLSEELTTAKFDIIGKGEFKEEFVTAGGVNRKDVNFNTMESKIVPGMFFAGEVLDVDGITGGFNFQNAWTTAWISAESIRKKAH
ncbi:MAG: NAD(P)/FAD-dependent oxidoreductase [Leptospira sp.]|nr:NAD(P)/FAD-dependent oxidoreductase [Leptospira sp.]